MDGIVKQIEDNSHILGSTMNEDDVIGAFNLLANMSHMNEPCIFMTGVGGFLNIMFHKYGRVKLPRKLKKRIYLTHKLRKKHLPKYYKK